MSPHQHTGERQPRAHSLGAHQRALILTASRRIQRSGPSPLPTRGPQHDPHGNVGALGGEDIILGYNQFSSTFVAGLADGSWVETRSVTRKPKDEAWNSEKMAATTTRPGERCERTARPRIRFENASLGKGETAVETPPTPGRQLMISMTDSEKHGYDDECPQCQHFQKYGKGTPNSAELGS